MKIITGIILTIGLLVAGLVLYRWDKEQRRMKKELEEKLAREKEAMLDFSKR
jgi:predicted histidine transporter YuiF (NhaC family)